MSLSVLIFFFLSQHWVIGDLCWSMEAGCSQHCEGLNLVLLWFWCWLTSRPLRLRPGQAVVERTKDFILYGVGGGWVGVGWRVRGWGNQEREGDWRAQHKGSYPPGSNTCHQLLPPSCAFIKKPPCALLGNPHALLKKCEVNTVCLSISLPLPPPSLHCSYFLSFCDVFCWAVERSPFSAWLCVFVCVYLYVCP